MWIKIKSITIRLDKTMLSVLIEVRVNGGLSFDVVLYTVFTIQIGFRNKRTRLLLYNAINIKNRW